MHGTQIIEAPASSSVRMKWYETTARIFIGLFYLFGAVDGAMLLFFGIYIHGKPHEAFLVALQKATYFWAFMKLIQFLGAASLLTNYKPALGLALLLPVSSVLCLFYMFELPAFMTVGSMVLLASAVLLHAYWKSYSWLLDDYR